jgi:hypothetical protein
MYRKSTPSFGALHPVLFFVVVYGISLFLAIFVCRTVYYGMNDKGAAQTEISAPSAGLTGSVAYK